MRVEMRRDWTDPRDHTDWRVTLARGCECASVDQPREVSWIRFIRASETYVTSSQDLWLDLDVLENAELGRLLDEALRGT